MKSASELIPYQQELAGYDNLEWRVPPPVIDKGDGQWSISVQIGPYPVVNVIAMVVGQTPNRELLEKPAHRELFDVVCGNWNCWFLWLIQKELSLWPATAWPFVDPYLRGQEAHASDFFIELEMCKNIHDTIHGKVLGYSNAWEHWHAVLLESYLNAFTFVTMGALTEKKMKNQKRNDIKLIKELRNPFSKSTQAYREHYNLCELALTMVKGYLSAPTKNRELREINNLWNDYKETNRDLLRRLSDKNWSELFVEGDRIVFKVGRTKKTYWTANPQKKFSSGRGRKPSKSK